MCIYVQKLLGTYIYIYSEMEFCDVLSFALYNLYLVTTAVGANS